MLHQFAKCVSDNDNPALVMVWYRGAVLDGSDMVHWWSIYFREVKADTRGANLLNICCLDIIYRDT